MFLKMVRIRMYIFHRRLLTKCHNIFFYRYKISQYKHLKDKKADMVKNQHVHKKQMPIHNLQKEEEGETQTSDPCFLKR